MKTFLRSVLAGAIVTLILAATEAVAGYPRPSAASGAFFSSAFMTYLPLAVLAAWILSVLLPGRGLDLWLPLGAGVLRMAGPLAGAASAGEWILPGAVLLAMCFILAVRVATESRTQSPPFLFGLTVGSKGLGPDGIKDDEDDIRPKRHRRHGRGQGR